MTVQLDRRKVAKRAAEAFIESHTVAFAIVSSDLRFADASGAFMDLFSPEGNDVKDLHLTDILYEFVGAEGELHKIFKGEMSLYSLELVSRTLDSDSPPYFAITVQPLKQSQPMDGLLLLLEDITPVGRLQQELVQERNELRLVRQKLDQANRELVQLNEMKSLFLSMAAHDLRGPLTAMYGYSDLLLEMKHVSSEMRDRALHTIRQQTERMHRLIDDLLSLNQIENNQLLISQGSFLLNEGIDEVVRSLALIIDREDISLHKNLPEPPLMLWVDSGKMMQILYNLLHNAAKFTPQGGQIRIDAYGEGATATIEFHNDGEGLTEDQLGSLFELFYRTEKSKSEKLSGDGLGLFIVKMLVEAQGGTIEAQSELGSGVTFILRLPIFEG